MIDCRKTKKPLYIMIGLWIGYLTALFTWVINVLWSE